VLLTKYNVQDGTHTDFKCVGRLNSEKIPVLSAIIPYDDSSLLFASSFHDNLLIDNIALWRNSRITSDIDIPYVALLNKDTLVFEDALSLFSETDPSKVYQPVGHLQNGTSLTLAYSGNQYGGDEYSFSLAQFSVRTCDNGVFNASGFCMCAAGGFGTESNPCPEFVQPVSDSSTPGSDSDGSRTPSEPTEKGSSEEEEAFLDSSTALIIFACTAGVFLIVSVVFIALFIKKRCGSSSDSKDVEMR